MGLSITKDTKSNIICNNKWLKRKYWPHFTFQRQFLITGSNLISTNRKINVFTVNYITIDAGEAEESIFPDVCLTRCVIVCTNDLK